MPFKLRDLMLDRVDLVPRGANPDATIMLFKSHKEDDVPAPKKKVKAAAKKAAAKPDTRSKSKQRGDEEEEEEEDDAVVAKGEDDEDDIEDDIDDNDEEASEEEEEPVVKSKVKGKGKKVQKATSVEDDEDEGDEDGDISDEDDDELLEETPERLMKGLPSNVRKALEAQNAIIRKQNEEIKKARKRAQEAEEAATIEKTHRVRLEFVTKAKTEIPNLPGTNEENGELLMRVFSKIDKTDQKALMKLLKAGDTAVRSSLMNERGDGGRSEGEESALDELRTKAKEIQKTDPKMSYHQAFEKACRDNGDIYRRYRVEKNGRDRRSIQ